jgi:hypothetical protein
MQENSPLQTPFKFSTLNDSPTNEELINLEFDNSIWNNMVDNFPYLEYGMGSDVSPIEQTTPYHDLTEGLTEEQPNHWQTTIHQGFEFSPDCAVLNDDLEIDPLDTIECSSSWELEHEYPNGPMVSSMVITAHSWLSQPSLVKPCNAQFTLKLPVIVVDDL